MKRKLTTLFFVSFCISVIYPAIVLTACNSTSIKITTQDVPARIIAVNKSSRTELQRIVSTALNIPSVLLANDALTKTNILIIEQKRRFGLNTNKHQAINEREKPSVFRLVKEGARCVLTLQGTDKRWVLKNTKCKPVNHL